MTGVKTFPFHVTLSGDWWKMLVWKLLSHQNGRTSNGVGCEERGSQDREPEDAVRVPMQGCVTLRFPSSTGDWGSRHTSGSSTPPHHGPGAFRGSGVLLSRKTGGWTDLLLGVWEVWESLREGGIGSWPSQISQVRGLQGMHPQNKCTHKRGPTGGSLSADSFALRRSSQEKGDGVPVRSNLCSSGKPVPLLPHTLPLAGRGLRGMTGGKTEGW